MDKESSHKKEWYRFTSKQIWLMTREIDQLKEELSRLNSSLDLVQNKLKVSKIQKCLNIPAPDTATP